MRASLSPTLLAAFVLVSICTSTTVASSSGQVKTVKVDPKIVEQNQKIADGIIAKSKLNIVTAPSITYGNQAAFGQFPFMASLQKTAGNATEPIHFCGGSLIWPNLVLTAGHCFYDSEKKVSFPSKGIVLVGGTIVPSQETPLAVTNAPEAFAISAYSIHPHYDNKDNKVPNDIGILVLNGQSTLPYVNLTRTAPTPGTVLTAMGWGLQENTNPEEERKLASRLMYTNIQVAANASHCYTKSAGDVPPGTICMDHFLVNKTDIFNFPLYQGSCMGDSGSPQIFSNTTIQASLTSYTSYTCPFAHSQWEADISVAYFYDSFIYPMIEAYGNPKPSGPLPSSNPPAVQPSPKAIGPNQALSFGANVPAQPSAPAPSSAAVVPKAMIVTVFSVALAAVLAF